MNSNEHAYRCNALLAGTRMPDHAVDLMEGLEHGMRSGRYEVCLQMMMRSTPSVLLKKSDFKRVVHLITRAHQQHQKAWWMTWGRHMIRHHLPEGLQSIVEHPQFPRAVAKPWLKHCLDSRWPEGVCLLLDWDQRTPRRLFSITTPLLVQACWGTDGPTMVVMMSRIHSDVQWNKVLDEAVGMDKISIVEAMLKHEPSLANKELMIRAALYNREQVIDCLWHRLSDSTRHDVFAHLESQANHQPGHFMQRYLSELAPPGQAHRLHKTTRRM